MLSAYTVILMYKAKTGVANNSKDINGHFDLGQICMRTHFTLKIKMQHKILPWNLADMLEESKTNENQLHCMQHRG